MKEVNLYTSQYNTPKTQDVGYYVDQTARTYLNRCLCALCHHLVPDYMHRLPIIYHHGHPPRWTADHISSTVARQVGDVRADPWRTRWDLTTNVVCGNSSCCDGLLQQHLRQIGGGVQHRARQPSSNPSTSRSLTGGRRIHRPIAHVGIDQFSMV